MAETSTMADAPDPTRDIAVVVGATGGLGAALCERLRRGGRFAEVIALGRSTEPALDVTDEDSIAAAAAAVKARGGPLRLVIDATGFLHGAGWRPEKSWRELDGSHLAHAFAVNATGPALLMKHFLPLLTARQRSVFATLSARVGSIADNETGGWYAYRASKAALNQLVRSAAHELARRKPSAICVALHPGTVDTQLSQPFSRSGLTVRPPDSAAGHLLAVIEQLPATASGGLYDYRGAQIPY